MRGVVPQVEAFEQPLQLLGADRLHPCAFIRPGEALGLEPLEPQAKAVAAPVQHLDLGALPIDDTSRAWANGSRPRSCSTSTDKPLIDLLKSIGARHR